MRSFPSSAKHFAQDRPEWCVMSYRAAPVIEKRGPGRPRKAPLPDPPSKGKLKVKAAPLQVKATARPVSTPLHPPLPPLVKCTLRPL